MRAMFRRDGTSIRLPYVYVVKALKELQALQGGSAFDLVAL
jgi:hypothetical protein